MFVFEEAIEGDTDMKKLIIIEHEPLTSRLEKIFSLKELLSNGVDVKYWDISQLCYAGIDIPETLNRSFLRCFLTINDFITALKKNNKSDTIFIVEVLMTWGNRTIFKLLKDSQCYCIRVDLYGNTTLPISNKNVIKKFLSCNFICNIPEKIKERYYRKMYLSSFYKKVLSSSCIAERDISINHPDYESFIFEEKAPIINEPYILFIDTYYPLHPDLKYYSKAKYAAVDVFQYHELMKSFFCFLENKYSKRVIIASHPKAKYTGGEFGNRKIIKGETCNLVKFADLIITHESNSLSFISLANKPFVFVYPDSYNRVNELLQYFAQLSQYCDKMAYNLDKCDWDLIEFSPLSDDFRVKYIYSYLTTPDADKNFKVFMNLL